MPLDRIAAAKIRRAYADQAGVLGERRAVYFAQPHNPSSANNPNLNPSPFAPAGGQLRDLCRLRNPRGECAANEPEMTPAASSRISAGACPMFGFYGRPI